MSFTVAKVKIEWFNSDLTCYTGMFKKAEHGIIRLSSAIQPISTVPLFFGKLAKAKLFPHCAMKFFVTNKDSVNILFAGKKIGQEEDFFFQNAQATNLTENSPMYLRWMLNLFRKYSIYPTQLGLSHFSSVTQEGQEETTDLKFPWILFLMPCTDSILSQMTFDDLDLVRTDSSILSAYLSLKDN